VLHRLHETFPSLPAQLRAYLRTLLRDSAADRPLARDLTRQWADDSDDQVAVTASAAFHTHLRHDHDGGTLRPGEWDAALAAIRREAVKRSFRPLGAPARGMDRNPAAGQAQRPSTTSAPGKFPHA
jgi:hypothetical protein